MIMTRRTTIGLLAGSVPALKPGRVFAQGAVPEIAPGPFQGTRESLKEYRIPDWFRDAKFGLWAHWGPQSAAECGDWYARNMYIEGSRQYKYHLKTYGHPSKFGFKDVIQTWKGDKFDPDNLLSLYKKAGAKYFCSMGVHCDNFDLWNSKYHRWNAVRMGPKKDIVGLFRKATLKAGLRFGVTEHVWGSYNWFATNKGADKGGPYAGVPYDGNDPANWDLYHEPHDIPPRASAWAELGNEPVAWKREWLTRIKDLVDQYEPDLLYTDGGMPFGEWGLALAAHYYNQSAKWHKGAPEGVYTIKRASDCAVGTCALDMERGVAAGIPVNPWQTDTCIGDWHYDKEAKYKTPKTIIDMLVDVVSRNGNLQLNFPLPNSGELDAQELKILDEITRWMAVNSEGIHGTRPWKIFGDGPVASAPAVGARGGAINQLYQGGGFNEQYRKDFTAEEVRFTTKGKTIYGFVMGWPEKQAVVKPLGVNSNVEEVKIENVELLGFKGKVKWTQDENGLTVRMPPAKPCDHAIALKIAVA